MNMNIETKMRNVIILIIFFIVVSAILYYFIVLPEPKVKLNTNQVALPTSQQSNHDFHPQRTRLIRQRHCDPRPAQTLNVEKRISKCPEDDFYLALWYLVMMKNNNKNKSNPYHDPNDRTTKKWNIVNIGSNKGYSIVAFLNALQVKPFTKQLLAKDIFDYGRRRNTPRNTAVRWHLAGVCCDPIPERTDDIWKDDRLLEIAKEISIDVSSLLNNNTDRIEINVLGVDATQSHIDYANEFFFRPEYLAQVPSNIKLNMKFVKKAISSYEMVERTKNNGQVLEFPQTELGNELGVMLPPASSSDGNKSSSSSSAAAAVEFSKLLFSLMNISFQNVSVTTLDDLLMNEGKFLSSKNDDEQPEIDVLLTDLEGFDLDAADGAKKLLKSGKVGIYILELNWGPASTSFKNDKKLGEFVSELAENGFTCYFPVYYQTATKRHVVNVTPSHDVIDRYLSKSRQQKQKRSRSDYFHHTSSNYSSARRRQRIEPNCFQERFNDEVRGFYNVICAGTRRNPELLEVFEILQGSNRFDKKNGKKRETDDDLLSSVDQQQSVENGFRTCSLERLKKEFFDVVDTGEEVRKWILEGL